MSHTHLWCITRTMTIHLPIHHHHRDMYIKLALNSIDTMITYSAWLNWESDTYVYNLFTHSYMYSNNVNLHIHVLSCESKSIESDWSTYTYTLDTWYLYTEHSQNSLMRSFNLLFVRSICDNFRLQTVWFCLISSISTIYLEISLSFSIIILSFSIIIWRIFCNSDASEAFSSDGVSTCVEGGGVVCGGGREGGGIFSSVGSVVLQRRGINTVEPLKPKT